MVGRHRFVTIVLSVVAIVGALGWFLWVGMGVGGVKQPIEFPHKKHIAQGLPCTTCHQRVERDAVAGRPPTAVCMGCHAAMESKSPEIKKLKAYGGKNQEVPWRRVWRLPTHVFFTHRIHVAVAKIPCKTCHGPMEALDRPPPRPLMTLTMDECMACHEKSTQVKGAAEKVEELERVSVRQILKDCNTCHR